MVTLQFHTIHADHLNFQNVLVQSIAELPKNAKTKFWLKYLLEKVKIILITQSIMAVDCPKILMSFYSGC